MARSVEKEPNEWRDVSRWLEGSLMIGELLDERKCLRAAGSTDRIISGMNFLGHWRWNGHLLEPHRAGYSSK